VALLAAVPAAAADKVSFGTNWRAEAEHGGFYQAVVDGTYARFGLDVTIVPGGPQANNLALLLADRIDFAMGLNLIQAFEAVQENVPFVVVAAEFQKDPMAIFSHPGVGLERWSDLPRATAFVGEEALVSVYRWLRHAFGFRAENVKPPYDFNTAPFIADKNSILLGYVTSEPYEIEKSGGFTPKYSCSPATATRPTRPRSSRGGTRSTTIPTSSGASLKPQPSVGGTISTETMRRRTQP